MKDKFSNDVLQARQPTINEEQVTIPPELVLSWDQTGIKLVPISEWTMAGEGSAQVPMKALEDKREITGLFCITMSGELLPPQILYAGKTTMCHPAVQ